MSCPFSLIHHLLCLKASDPVFMPLEGMKSVEVGLKVGAAVGTKVLPMSGWKAELDMLKVVVVGALGSAGAGLAGGFGTYCLSCEYWFCWYCPWFCWNDC